MSYYYDNDNNSGGGRRSWFLPNTEPVTRAIIIINIIVYIFLMMDRKGILDANFALWSPLVPYFKPWQLVSYMFLHGGFFHIFFNMYTLYIFGNVIERILGQKKFLTLYFVCGIGAGLVQMLVQYLVIDVSPTIGASGAIYGIIIAYAMLFPTARLTLIFPPVTMNAKTMVLVFIGIELVTGVLSTGNVAHFAHLGGMLFGWLLIFVWRKTGKLFDRNNW